MALSKEEENLVRMIRNQKGEGAKEVSSDTPLDSDVDSESDSSFNSSELDFDQAGFFQF